MNVYVENMLRAKSEMASALIRLASGKKDPNENANVVHEVARAVDVFHEENQKLLDYLQRRIEARDEALQRALDVVADLKD